MFDSENAKRVVNILHALEEEISIAMSNDDYEKVRQIFKSEDRKKNIASYIVHYIKDGEKPNFIKQNKAFIINDLFKANPSICLFNELLTDEEIKSSYEEKEIFMLVMNSETSKKHFRELCPNYKSYRRELLDSGQIKNKRAFFDLSYDRSELLKAMVEDEDLVKLHIYGESQYMTALGSCKFETAEDVMNAMKVATKYGLMDGIIVSTNMDMIVKEPGLFAYAFNNFNRQIKEDVKFPEKFRKGKTLSKIIKSGEEPLKYTDLRPLVTDAHLRDYVANQPNTFEVLNTLASVPEYRKFLSFYRYIDTAFADLEEAEQSKLHKQIIVRKLMCSLPKELYTDEFKEVFAEKHAFKSLMDVDLNKLSYEDLQKRSCSDVRNISREFTGEDKDWLKDEKKFIDMAHAYAFINDGYKDSIEIPGYYKNHYMDLNELGVKLKCTDAIGHMKKVDESLNSNVVMKENIYAALGIEFNQVEEVYGDINIDFDKE